MSQSTRAVGDRLEHLVVERRGWEHYADGGDHREQWSHWFDARTPDGTPVEIKGTVVEKSRGHDRAVPGEWWIQRDNHRRLRDAHGRYALVVYRSRSGAVEVLESCCVPARLLDPFIYSWFDTTGSQTDGQATTIPWPRVFGDLQEGDR